VRLDRTNALQRRSARQLQVETSTWTWITNADNAERGFNAFNASVSWIDASEVLHPPAMNETLTIRLGENLAHALQAESSRTGLPKGEIARQALESRLRQGGKLAVMHRHFGVVRGPSDQSTNKSYRRDWNKKRK
jgi:hypothetical protein